MKDKKNKRKKIKKKFLYRRIVFFSFLFLLGFCLVFLILSFSRIEKIKTKGMARVSESSVEKVIDNIKGKKYFFINKKKTEKILEDIPYVKSADLSYTFPRILEINIKEEVPYAQIFIKEGYVLVNENMKILEKTKTFDTSLPKITGIQASENKLGSNIFSKDSNQSKKDFFLNLFSSKLMDEITSIDIMEQGLQIFTKSGIKVIVRSYQDSSYKIKQLEKIYPRVQGSEEEFGTILLDQSDHPIAIKQSDLENNSSKNILEKEESEIEENEKKDKSKEEIINNSDNMDKETGLNEKKENNSD